jgi:mRNA-degrading endonuclease RelE of RelBE toxin-antitoxin system
MNFDVVYTDNFKRKVQPLSNKYRSLKNDLEKLIDALEENPAQGTPIGRDCYKIRMAITSKRKGKSG